jgi:short-subunit dehydrogenase
MADWNGRRVLITGASSGIGAALARELASAGATVGLCARRAGMLDEVLADCRRTSPSSRAWTIDLAELDGIPAFVARVEQELGGIDVLINNAGGGEAGATTEMSWEEIEYLDRLNYLSPVRLTLAALPAMRARGSGQVTVVSSMAARWSTPGEAAYAGPKAAVAGFIEALAAELWGRGITFHLVYPALIDLTPGVDGDDALADSTNPSRPIPAPVLARAMRAQLETGEFELYMPHVMKDQVASRIVDVAGSVEFMARWYQDPDRVY